MTGPGLLRGSNRGADGLGEGCPEARGLVTLSTNPPYCHMPSRDEEPED